MNERKRDVDLKDEEIRRLEANAKNQIEALQTEKDFLVEDLRKFQESLKRKENQKPAAKSVK